jgi:aminopeptidase N
LPNQVALSKKLDNAAFLFPNLGDHGYFKILLDPSSLAFAQKALETFKDALLRQLLWQTFYNMTRDAAMKSTDYLRLVREKLGFESDVKLIQTILDRAGATLANFVPSAVQDAEADGLFDVAWTSLHRADNAELRIIWARAAISFAGTKSRAEKLAAFLDKPDITGFEFDQGMRWSVVHKAIAHGAKRFHPLSPSRFSNRVRQVSLMRALVYRRRRTATRPTEASAPRP